MKRVIICIAIAACVLPMRLYAEGLDTLIEVGKDQADIQKAYEAETKAYTAAKRAIETGTIKKGQTKDDIQRRCGQPVIDVDDFMKSKEKWVYKPASSDLNKGPRVYLFFDKGGLLTDIETFEK